MDGGATTPAAILFTVALMFHHKVAKLLYLHKKELVLISRNLWLIWQKSKEVRWGWPEEAM